MADRRAMQKARHWFPERYISMLVQLLMGISIASGQTSNAGVVVFFQSRTHISSVLLGLGFILSGLLTGITQQFRVYIGVNAFVFGSYALVALYGWLIANEVPAQNSILAFGVCLFTLWSYPEAIDA
jgi:hypothetical protein